MNHLIIFAHPNPNSLNAHLKNEVFAFLKEHGHRVKIRDLYQNSFDPILSIKDLTGQISGELSSEIIQEQDYINWADCITFIHPIWWTGLPAILKGYIDRVFTYGFAYRYDHGKQKGLLTGKKAVVINTQGKSAEEYAELGMDKALKLTSETGIYEYCGLDIQKHFFVDRAEQVSADILQNWERKIKRVFSRLIPDPEKEVKEKML